VIRRGAWPITFIFGAVAFDAELTQALGVAQGASAQPVFEATDQNETLARSQPRACVLSLST